MRVANCGLIFLLLLAGLQPGATASSTSRSWMGEDAMRQAFIGKTLDGHYVGGLAWTETYSNEGRLDYREAIRSGTGRWFFRGEVFCTFYDPGFGLNGGCWRAIQTGANCYEFYVTDLPRSGEESDAAPGPLDGWLARGWRNSEPSTCQDRPSA